MSGAQMMEPTPVCEVCWLKNHSRWEPHSMDDNGNIKMALKGVDVPQKINTGAVESCSECGKITIAGIYQLSDPDIISTTEETISFEDEEDQEEYYGEDTNEG